MCERVTNRAVLCVLALGLGAGLAGCGQARTAAATQPTPAAFDPAASDDKALAVVDEMLATLGGAAAWGEVKQLRWELKYYQDGKLMGWFRHAWDIWNGRHRYEFADPAGLQTYNASGGTEPPVFIIAMYDLFDHQGKGFVTNSVMEDQPGGGAGAMAADRDRIVAEAYKSWQRDSYQISMLYKLKDPGVKLSYVGERQNYGGKCQPACVDIKVTFAPEVGTDLYHVYINKDSKLPEVIERDVDGTRSVAFRIESWIQADGFKFPEVLRNIGPAEEFRIERITIGEPEDELYVPRIRG